MNRLLICLALVGLLASAVAAADLGNVAPAKQPAAAGPVAAPADARQGGDTFADAVTITVPYAGTGTTEGYNHDYDGDTCPYVSTPAPDVVYRFDLAEDMLVAFDLWGSSFDTKVYVFDQDLNEINCNDDYYADYTSYLELALLGGQAYYVVIDGYDSQSFGVYELAVAEVEPCDIDIPVDAVAEGEPPLQDDVPDCYNNGCGTLPCDPPHNWQALAGDPVGELVLHGRSGWYTYSGVGVRDTDWFELVAGETGTVTILADADEAVWVYNLQPLDCDSVQPVWEVEAGPCEPGEMTVTAAPGQILWVWVGPVTFAPPGGADTPVEFDYVLWLSGLAAEPVAVEARTWTDVKGLYR